MPALFVPHEETFARTLASGVSLSKAGAEAGYARHWKRACERAARPNIAARARELHDERPGTPEFVVPDISAYLPLSDEDWAAKYGPRG